MQETKVCWDPEGVFNARKIVNTPPMDTSLRYEVGDSNVTCHTYFDFSKEKGWLCAIEQCNGSGDCRKSYAFGGTMCPSFRATREESHTTRARANTLRELITHPRTKKIYDQREILEVLDTCVSCKACKSECPSNVDIARFKAEFLQQHYDECR